MQNASVVAGGCDLNESNRKKAIQVTLTSQKFTRCVESAETAEFSD